MENDYLVLHIEVLWPQKQSSNWQYQEIIIPVTWCQNF